MILKSSGSRRRWILIAMGFGGGLIVLDETVIGIALPSLRRDLGMSQVAAHWVVSAYLLTFAGFAAAGGRLGDLLGLRNVFVGSLVIFAMASLAAGFAESGAWLIGARAAQGLGAAMIFPLSMAMVSAGFPTEERGKAIGVVAAMGTMFLAAGPLIGGLFTEHLSWRWIFWCNVPLVGLVAGVVLNVWDEPPRNKQRAGLDAGGLISLVTGLGLVVFAIMEAARLGWVNPIILGGLAAGLGILALFAVLERQRSAPLLDVNLFGDASLSASIMIIFATQLSKIVVVVFGALYLQDSLGMSPLTAGWALLAAVVATPLTAAPSGRAADKYGARGPALLGLTVVAVALIWIGLVAPLDDYLLLAPALLIWGAAGPLCFLPSQRAVMNAAPPDKQGQAGGMGITARLLGGTAGMALGSTLLAMTDSFRAVFLATGVIVAAVLSVAWFAIERPPSPPTP